MFNARWFFRMSRWGRNPPARRTVILYFLVIAICLMLFGLERLFGWPDWLTMDNTPRGRIAR